MAILDYPWLYLTEVRRNLEVVLICIFLIAKGDEHFGEGYLVTIFISIENFLFRFPQHWVISFLESSFFEFLVYSGLLILCHLHNWQRLSPIQWTSSSLD